MLTPEPLEPVNDWQTTLAVVGHPDDLVFDRAAAVARWTSRASTSCTAR
jgi:LmbE family N-acetylglucosaminyl deacetylase